MFAPGRFDTTPIASPVTAFFPVAADEAVDKSFFLVAGLGKNNMPNVGLDAAGMGGYSGHKNRNALKASTSHTSPETAIRSQPRRKTLAPGM